MPFVSGAAYLGLFSRGGRLRIALRAGVKAGVGIPWKWLLCYSWQLESILALIGVPRS